MPPSSGRQASGLFKVLDVGKLKDALTCVKRCVSLIFSGVWRGYALIVLY